MRFARLLPSSLLSTSALSLTLLSALPTAGAAQTTSSDLVLDSALSAALIDHQVEAAGPESDWNCLDIGIMETGLRVIMPNYRSGDPTYVSAMKVLAKALWEQTVFVADGEMGDDRDNGTLVGFELAVFEGLVVGPPIVEFHSSATILGPDASGTKVELGTLYAFDSADWAQRKLDLMNSMGGVAPSQHPVWRGETLFAGGTGTSMRMLGLGNTLFGCAYGADQFRLGGDQWTVRDILLHFGLYMQFGTGHQIGGTAKPMSATPQPKPVQSSSAYMNLAGAGQVFNGDLQVLNDGSGGAMSPDGTSLSGLVFVSGDVFFDGSYVTARLTIVAGGSVDVAGSNNNLTPAVDDLLFYSFTTDSAEAIAVDGSSNALTGSIYGPYVEVRVGGSNNAMTGRFVGAGVKVTGGSNVFSDGTE